MRKISTGLLLAVSLPVLAQRPAQYCSGKIVDSVAKKKVYVTYSETKDDEGKISFVSVTVGNLREGFATFEENQNRALIDINPAGNGEVIVAKRTAQELLLVLQRQGSRATLTYLNDQNLILSNAVLKCIAHDDA